MSSPQFADDDLVAAALRAGAVGYLHKSMLPEQIRSAVRSAAEGQTALAPALIDQLAREYTARRVEPSPLLGQLTARETDVLREIARGRSNLEIARTLHVSEGTVKTHVAHSCANCSCATAPRPRWQPTSWDWSGPVRATRGPMRQQRPVS